MLHLNSTKDSEEIKNNTKTTANNINGNVSRSDNENTTVTAHTTVAAAAAAFDSRHVYYVIHRRYKSI